MTLQQLQVREIQITQEMAKLSLPGRVMGFIGSVGGVVYSIKTGGGFWRGVGYWLLGGLIVGGGAYIINAGQLESLAIELTQVQHQIALITGQAVPTQNLTIGY